MKKSKIIVPALGILAFSTAAAVTGTVAWFTANRLAIVSNSNITVVNPEAGLSVVATNVANTVVANGETAAPSITHAKVGENQGYLRDASMNVATGKLYKSVLGEDGTVTGYTEQAIATADTKTYDGKALYFATQFKLDFKVTRVDSGYESGLFFDANASSVVATSLQNVYKSVRFGIKCGDNWVVWAPSTGDNADATNESVEPKVYAVRNVTGTALANVADIAAANRIVGNGGATTTSAALNDSEGVLANTVKTNTTEYAYMGPLDKTTALTVNVYTWFEGTDTACVNANFESVQDTFTSTLKFISRRVAA